MLEEERLLYPEGWRQPKNVANGFTMLLLASLKKLLYFSQGGCQSIHLRQRSRNGILESCYLLMSVVGSAINVWS